MAHGRDRFLSDEEIVAAAPETLAAHFRPLADRLASRVRRDCPDTQADAYLGLVRAAERYDPAKGPFVPYATLWIRQAITRGAGGQRNAIFLPPAVRQRLASVLEARSRLPHGADDEQIAAALGGEWTAEQVTRVLATSRAVPEPESRDADGDGSWFEARGSDDLEAAAMLARVDLEAILGSLPDWLAAKAQEWLDSPGDARAMNRVAALIRDYLDGRTLL